MKQLRILRDASSLPTWAIPLTDANYNNRILAGVEKTVAVPAGAVYALISASDWFFVGRDTVALPAAGEFVLANGHQAKEIVDLETNTTTPVANLHFIARGDTDISVSFYGY